MSLSILREGMNFNGSAVEDAILKCQSDCIDKHWSGEGEIKTMWAGVVVVVIAMGMALFLPQFLEKVDAIRKERLNVEASEAGKEVPKDSLEKRKKYARFFASAIALTGLTLIVTGIFQRIFTPSHLESCEDLCSELKDFFLKEANCSSLN